MQWIIDNKEWVFSGIGVFALTLLVGFFVRNKSTTKQTQKSGPNSINYQAGGDIKIGRNDDK